MGAGATVSVYVDAPLCEGAERELRRAEGRAGEPRVRAVCVDPVRAGGRLDLAAIGSNARRAAEDSATVAYIGVPDPAVARFSRPILAEAGIARLAARSGGRAMIRTLGAIRAAADESGSLRESVREQLAGD